MRTINKKYHYFYKITNILNNHYYYGIHSTDDLNDGYMGSGTRLRYAYEKYGIEHFTKEILKFFNTREEVAKYEAEIVNEVLLRDEKCYNIVRGGENMNWLGTVTGIDKNGNGHRVLTSDIRFKTGELTYMTKGYGTYKDKDNNIIHTSTNDIRVLNKELVGLTKGKVSVKDIHGNTFQTDINDPRYLSGELVSVMKNKLIVKDNKGNIFHINTDDPRYLSGELVPIWKNRKHRPETIEKFKNTYKKIGHQQGEKNSQFGTCWITKDGISKKIKKEELIDYINNGWMKGRKIKK